MSDLLAILNEGDRYSVTIFETTVITAVNGIVDDLSGNLHADIDITVPTNCIDGEYYAHSYITKADSNEIIDVLKKSCTWLGEQNDDKRKKIVQEILSLQMN